MKVVRNGLIFVTCLLPRTKGMLGLGLMARTMSIYMVLLQLESMLVSMTYAMKVPERVSHMVNLLSDGHAMAVAMLI